MRLPLLVLWVLVAVTGSTVAAPTSSEPWGRIDGDSLVSASHGTFAGVPYVRYEAMFEGVTSNNRAFRVPCQIVAPEDPADGSGLLLFEWLVASTIVTDVGQEQADSRYTMTDEFLFGLGLSFATVRCDPAAIGKESPIVDPTRPWSDDLLDTSSESIRSAGDEFDIVVAYVKALRSDPVALEVLGSVDQTAAFAYSQAGFRLRGLLRLQMGKGLFDVSFVGGTGHGFSHPTGNGVGFSSSEKPPLAGAGLEIDFQSESDVLALDAHKARHEEDNYRVYQFAGAAHIRDVDAAEFGLPDPESANPADWTPFFRALFVAGIAWCDGVEPPASLWLGAPNDARIVRDAKGNALVRYVGGQAVTTTGHRLPEVAVGENQYIAVDPSYDDGTLLGTFRVLAGGHVDLTGDITDHDQYVADVTAHAAARVGGGYLPPAAAAAIVAAALDSDVGQ
jgi:hypothetical protein